MCTTREMIDFLSNYEYAEGQYYTPTERACQRILDVQREQKGDLIKVLRQHPNYNGNGQIVLDAKFSRERDDTIIHQFLNWLESEGKDAIRRYVGDYVKVKETIDRLPNSWVSSMNKFKGKTVHVIDISGANFLCAADGEEWWYDISTLTTLDGREIDEEAFMFSPDISAISTAVYDSGQYVDDMTIEKLNERFPWLKAHSNAKLSRVVQKICKHYNINESPEWNAMYTKFADAVNPLQVDTRTIISWNPIDYWTMSFGNSWASCHTIDKTNKREMPNDYEGMYCAGTESYMLDPSSVVVYVIDKSYKGNEWHLQPKVMRQMFHIAADGSRIIQGRLYPQDNDTGSKEKYDTFRQIVQRVVSECFDQPNGWTVAKGTVACADATISIGDHYKDYLFYDNCTVSTLRGEIGAIVNIGHPAICPSCGQTHYESDNIQCEDCRETGLECECCGDYVSEDEAITAYDRYGYEHVFCCSRCAEREGYVLCGNTEEYREEDDPDVIFDDYYGYYWYGDRDEFVWINCETYGNEDNANSDGYYYCSRCGEWSRDYDFNLEMCLDCVAESEEEVA